MQTLNAHILAASTGYQAAVGGRVFLIQSCDVGNVLTVTLTNRIGHRYVAQGVGPAFKVTPVGGFNQVEIATSVDANVSFIVADGDVDMQNGQVDSLIVNTAANPVHVTIDGGAVQLTATNVGINNTTANPVPVQLHATDITLPVSLAALPQLAAGGNAIGTVGVTALPALPAGANAIGTVGVTALPALPAGANAIGTVGVTALPALPAGTNTIGVITDNTQQARALAGKGFSGVGTQVGVASDFAQIILWNPVGSGVKLYVEQINVMQEVSNQQYLMGAVTAISGTVAQAGVNKLLGGAASKGQIYINAVAGGAGLGAPNIGMLGTGSEGSASYPQAEPIVIPEGYGLAMQSNSAGATGQATIEWYEQ